MHTGSSTSNDEKKPCRTCTDFRTWAKQQKNIYESKSEVQRKLLGYFIVQIKLVVLFIKGIRAFKNR